MESRDITTCVWDANMDCLYRNYIDLQKSALIVQAKSAKMALSDAAWMVLQETIQKVSVEEDVKAFFNRYSEDEIPVKNI